MMNTDIAGKLDVNQITNRLAMMDDTALQTYAKLHKNDPFLLPLAVSESNRRKARRAAAQAQQYTPQPPVNDAQIAQMQAPAPQMQAPQMQAPAPQMAAAGIPQLAARNIETMADGGIAGYAEGSTKPIFNADKYLEDPRVQRFLEYINVSEGSPQPNQMVGYRRFDDMSKHPNKRIKFNKRGDKSSAAGAYQIINSTWQEQAKKQGLTDFSLENQKRAAVGLLKETGALDALLAGDVEKAKRLAARKWASIPGSTIGESTGQKARFNERAEALLKDLTPQTVAQRPAAPARKPKPKQREEFAGLSPDLARQITSALPIASAQAADTPPRVSPEYVRSADGRTISGPISTERYEGQRFPRAELEAGIAGLPKRNKFVDPLAKQREQLSKEFTLPSGREIGSAAAATGDYLYNLLPFAAGEAGYAAGRMFGVPEESAKKVPEFFAGFTDPLSRFFKTKGTPEDEAALTRKIEKFVGENIEKGADWISENSKEYTGMPISKRDAENIINNVLIAAPFLRKKAKGAAPSPEPIKGEAEARGRIADAETVAKEAADKIESMERGRITADTPSRATGPNRAAEQRAGEVAYLERALEIAESNGDAARAAELRAKIEERNPPTFPVNPADRQVGQEAKQKRQLAQQAADVRRARDNAAAAEKAAADIKAMEEGRIAEMSVVPRTTTPNVPFVRPRTATAAVAGSRAPVPEAYDDIIKSETLGSQDTGFPSTPFTPDAAAPVSPTPAPETARVPEAKAEDKPFGLDKEDLLMLGLGMLASPGGQAGGELSQLFQNLGRSGLSTVAMKREREKAALEKEYRETLKDYYSKMASTLGRPELEERKIQKLMEEKNLTFSQAYKLLKELEYDPRGDAQLAAIREKAALDPMNRLFDDIRGLKTQPSGDLFEALQKYGYAG